MENLTFATGFLVPQGLLKQQNPTYIIMYSLRSPLLLVLVFIEQVAGGRTKRANNIVRAFIKSALTVDKFSLATTAATFLIFAVAIFSFNGVGPTFATESADGASFVAKGSAAVQAPHEPPVRDNTAQSANNQYEVRLASYTPAGQVVKRMAVPMTAYSSTVDQTDSTPFITASGTRVHWGTVAANFLPFGTKIKIPSMYGDQVFVVEDRMNKRYWHKVDIWMPTRQDALNFGVRTLEIEILDH